MTLRILVATQLGHAVLCMGLLSGGCRSAPKTPPLADAVGGDAGLAGPVAASNTDAGTVVQGAVVGVDAGTAERAVDARPTVFDRILVKPSAQLLAGTANAGAAATFQKRLEAALDARVADLRRSAGSWYVVTLVPLQPPRSADGQRALVEKLKASADIAAAEPDTMLQLK